MAQPRRQNIHANLLQEAHVARRLELANLRHAMQGSSQMCAPRPCQTRSRLPSPDRMQRICPSPNAVRRPLAKTAGSTIPQPSNSIQPECLHLRQPLPPQKMQLICTSALGSVNGKKLGKKRVFTSEPKSAFIA